jgi:CheY-like chemotaxis protein
MLTYNILLVDDREEEIRPLREALAALDSPGTRVQYVSSRNAADRYLATLPAESEVAIVTDLYMKAGGISEGFSLIDDLSIKDELLPLTKGSPAHHSSPEQATLGTLTPHLQQKLERLRDRIVKGLPWFGTVRLMIKRPPLILIYSAYATIEKVTSQRAKDFFRIYLGCDSIDEKLKQMSIPRPDVFDKTDPRAVSQILARLIQFRSAGTR